MKSPKFFTITILFFIKTAEMSLYFTKKNGQKKSYFKAIMNTNYWVWVNRHMTVNKLSLQAENGNKISNFIPTKFENPFSNCGWTICASLWSEIESIDKVDI